MKSHQVCFLILGLGSFAYGMLSGSFECQDADESFCTTNSVTAKGTPACKSSLEYVYKCMKTCGYCELVTDKADKITCEDKSKCCAEQAPDEAACEADQALKLSCCDTCMKHKYDIPISDTLSCVDKWSQCTASTGTLADGCCPHLPTFSNKDDKAGRKNYKNRCRGERDTQKNCLQTCDICTGRQQSDDNTSPSRFKCKDQLKETSKKDGCTADAEASKCDDLTTNSEYIFTCCATCIKRNLKTALGI